ncbi:MAG TPA: hypothetical protein VFD92_09295 [Candidatus Binatia bacterium]|nr:hypothetical protein [Candidatus Binatia bacterium]
MTVARRRAGAAAFAALAAWLAGACRSTPAVAPAPHEVRYRLAWATPRGPASADGAAEITNDLGYRIRIRRGWVTSYSMELVECPKTSATSAAARAVGLAWSWLEGTAWAGHSAGTPNPAAIRPMRVESLLEPATRDVGAVELAPQAYCQVHYLVARAGRDAQGLPDDLDMVDRTLHVEGTYVAPGASAEIPFTIQSAAAYGQLFDRAAGASSALRVDTGRESVEVTIRRHLDRMFDGVDFARMPEKAAALQMLRSLVDHSDAEVVPSHANG